MATMVQKMAHHVSYEVTRNGMTHTRKGMVVTVERPTYWGVRRTYRAYGGPEEGGWYYDAEVEHLNVRKFTSHQDQADYVRDLVVMYELRPGLPGRWSYNAGDGTYYELVDSTSPFRDEKNRRPRWE